MSYDRLRRPLFWGILLVGILSSTYALSHRFLHDRMQFNCHQIGCMSGEPDKVAETCRCGEVNILAVPCSGAVDCSSGSHSCSGGRYCKAFLPDCLKEKDCTGVDLEAPPSLEEIPK